MFVLSSPQFQEQGVIPKKYTGEGEDVSPPLKWSGVPGAAQELVLIAEDPDAPTDEPWVHWLIYDLSPSATNGIPEGTPRKERLEHPLHARQGMNSFDQIGYGGPMPPRGHGAHRYFFKLYALDKRLDLQPELNKADLLLAITPHILAETHLMGRYERRAKAA